MSLFSKEQNWTSLMSVTLRNRYKHCYPVCFNCFYWRKLQKVHFGLTFKTVIKTIFRICKTSMSTSTLKEVVQSYLYKSAIKRHLHEWKKTEGLQHWCKPLVTLKAVINSKGTNSFKGLEPGKCLIWISEYLWHIRKVHKFKSIFHEVLKCLWIL